MLQLFKSFWSEESGQTLAEYALLLGLIAIVVIVVLVVLGNQIKNVFNAIRNHLEDVPASG